MYACHAGTAYARAWDEGGYGWWVELVGVDGFVTQYGHLSAYAFAGARPVAAGDLIGWSGNTGGSTGPHLHLRVKVAGAASGFDPLGWLAGAPYVGASIPAGDLADTPAGVAWRWARSAGLSPAGAAGVVGNLLAESRALPDSVECRGQVGQVSLEAALGMIVPGRCEGLGVLQWSFGRRDALVEFVRRDGRPWYDLGVQLDFLRAEVEASAAYRAMWAALGTDTDPVVAARRFDDVFVRSGIKGARFDLAREVYAAGVAGRYGSEVVSVKPAGGVLSLPAWMD